MAQTQPALTGWQGQVTLWFIGSGTSESQNDKIKELQSLAGKDLWDHQPPTTTNPRPHLTHPHTFRMLLGMMTWTSYPENHTYPTLQSIKPSSPFSPKILRNSASPVTWVCYSTLKAEKLSKHTSQADVVPKWIGWGQNILVGNDLSSSFF